jgi:hypothetical protein
MVTCQSPVAPSVTPAQVWVSLSTDLQSHAIRLLAQLACTYAATQIEPPNPEVPHVLAPVSNQDPPGTS